MGWQIKCRICEGWPRHRLKSDCLAPTRRGNGSLEFGCYKQISLTSSVILNRKSGLERGSQHAWDKVARWAREGDEFVKRAAFALLASLGAHDKNAEPDRFAQCLPLIEKAATDERNFVKKGVSWALRVIGRRNRELHDSAVTLAKRLAESPQAGARWVGKDALRDLTKPALVARFNRSRSRTK